MASGNTNSGTGKCPVYFCGTPQGMTGFATLLANAQKQSSIEAIAVPTVTQALEKSKDVEFGIFLLLVENKNDLVAVLNVLVAIKKKLDKGALRVLAYNGLDNDRVANVLKSKGCAETLADGLTQKALVYKLQKHIQIVSTKAKALQRDQVADTATVKSNAAKKASDRLSSEDAKIKFVAALTDPNDCWLIKNKRDFKFIRGNWIGEMIGPGPSVGSWIEAGGTTKQPIFCWTPRNKEEPNPFVPGKGFWFVAGRKPEFDWKINRWRFVGEAPSLFFRSSGGATPATSVFRFRAVGPASIEVALNSNPAKAKLKSIVATFDDEKLIKEDKKKGQSSEDLALEKEGKKASKGEDYERDAEPDKDEGDWDLETEDEGGRQWGALKEGKKEKGPAWDDRSNEGEEEETDWTGLDTGRGNKFNGGRGVGQGDGGSKGYKHDEEEEREAGEEEPEHDWTGLDIGRGNKFNSGRGLGQGDGDKGYEYEKDKKKAKHRGEADEDLEPEETEDEDLDSGDDADFDLDADSGDGPSKPGKKKATPVLSQEERQKKLEAGANLDELFGKPEEDTEWDTGADAFSKITLDITVSRPDSPGSPSLGDVSLLERRGLDLLLDAPAKSFKLGERVSFAVVLGETGEGKSSKKKLQLSGQLKSTEPSSDDREIILVAMGELSKPHLAEIQTVFDKKQAQLLKFLREAKG